MFLQFDAYMKHCHGDRFVVEPLAPQDLLRVRCFLLSMVPPPKTVQQQLH
jgi:hypothetical protein